MKSLDEFKTERKVRFTLPSEEELGRANAVRGRVVSQKQLTAIQQEMLALKIDEHKVHGTARYINGTLNFSTTDYKSPPTNTEESNDSGNENKKSDSHRFKPKLLTSCLSSAKKKTANKTDSDHSNSSINATGIHQIDSPIRKDILPKLNSLSKTFNHHIQMPTSKSIPPKKKVKKPKKPKARRFIFLSPSCLKRRKRPKLLCAPTRRKRKIADRIPDTLNVPAFKAMQRLRYHLYDNDQDVAYSAINQHFMHLRTQRNSNANDEGERQMLLDMECSTDTDSDDEYDDDDYSVNMNKWKGISVNDLSQKPNPLSRDGSFSSFIDFVQRWRRVQGKSLARINQWKRKQLTAAVDSSGFKNSDVNLARSKMCSTVSLMNHYFTTSKVSKSVPLITTLLRASRNQDEELIKNILQHILSEGISEEDLNATDASGRTAISYICSTNVTQFLELLLRTPGIDINKPDIELNTPLHHAAESGQVGAVKLLLSESRVHIDAKNIFGFTPLMKAAIQGHTRCSKLLLFAGASPMVTDYGRGLRAGEWARFCSRHLCAEMIEKCTRTALLDKDNAIRWNVGSKEKVVKGRARANSTVPTTSKVPFNTNNNIAMNNNNGGIRSKLSKVFNFVSRDKSSFQVSHVNYNTSHSSPGSRKNSSDIESNFDAVSSGSVTRYEHKFGRSVARPLEVPKLEVTSPHNQDLIRKYETRYNPPLDNSKPPALPPRRNSKNSVI